MTPSPYITPVHASPGMHVKIRCQNCRNQIEFYLRGGMNRLECNKCRKTTEIEAVHSGHGWEARPGHPGKGLLV